MKLENLKETRKAMKIKQKDFAKKYNIPIRTLQNWENGITEPPPYILWMIDYIMILENECEHMKSGQMLLGQSKEQNEEPKSEDSTETVRKKIFKDIQYYMNFVTELSCKDCKWDNSEDCKDKDCEWKNYIYYREYKEIIAEELRD